MDNALETKPSNPKDLIGSDKLPLDLVPTVTMAYGALGHLEGHLKYGLVNWREAGVRTSIYIAAMKRHIQKFADAGEWADPVTHVPHLGSVIACCGIILDAYHAGKLIDDRPKPNPAVATLIDDLGETVKHLKTLFADKHPTHYTISGPVVDSGGHRDQAPPVVDWTKVYEDLSDYEYEGPLTCEDGAYRRDGVLACNASHYSLVCTLPYGHGGPHVATDVDLYEPARTWGG